MHHQVVILGAGPAGYTAALYAARSGLNPVVVTGPLPGGQLVYTHHIENFPGFMNVPGVELIESFDRQVLGLGVSFTHEAVEKVDFSSRPFHLDLSGGEHITANAVIIAMGSSPRWLGIPGEESFKGKGISICATCDGFFYRGKKVVVIGGGNTALYEAIFLSTFAASVTVIHRNERLSGEKALMDQVMRHPKINILWNTEVESFVGHEKLTKVVLKNLKTDEVTDLPVDGAFVAIGQTPNTALFKGQLEIDPQGFIVTNHETRETSIPGVFAAGDIQEPIYRQAIIACGSGCIAALSAEKFLLEGAIRF